MEKEHRHKDRGTTIAAASQASRLIANWGSAWNDHDIEKLAQLVAEDVVFVTVAGNRLLGRQEFLAHHQGIHHERMRNSSWCTLGWELRTLSGDLLLLHVEWSMVGDREPDGTTRPLRLGVFTWIAVASMAGFQILAAHNTDLRADSEHRTPSALAARHNVDGVNL